MLMIMVDGGGTPSVDDGVAFPGLWMCRAMIMMMLMIMMMDNDDEFYDTGLCR